MQLPNFPNYSQLDGSVNQSFDCVPTSIADALTYLTGKYFTGSQIKDAAYGADYTGATTASAYIDFCAAQGVRLFPIDGDGPALVQAIREQLAQGRPVLGTESDPYANPSLGWSHVICFYKWDEPAGTLTARDPYSTQDATTDDTTWAAILEFHQVWALERTTMIPQGWRDDGQKLTAPTGFTVVQGFREYILTHPWNPDDQPLENEQPRAQLELSNPGLGAGTRQRFRLTTLEWNQQRGVFVAWIGQELGEVERRLTAAQHVTPLNPALMQQLESAVQGVNSAFGTLKNAIATNS